MDESGMNVGLQGHECAAAADAENSLLHKQASLVGQRQQLQWRTQQHVCEGRPRAVCQQLHVDSHTVVTLCIKLQEHRLKGFDCMPLEVMRDDSDEFWGGMTSDQMRNFGNWRCTRYLKAGSMTCRERAPCGTSARNRGNFVE
jgi:hypothetical protein